MFEGIFSPSHILLVAAVGLLIFGPKRLPELGKALGKWLGDFRRATSGIGDELKAGLSDSTKPAEATKAADAPAEPGARPPAPPAATP